MSGYNPTNTNRMSNRSSNSKRSSTVSNSNTSIDSLRSRNLSNKDIKQHDIYSENINVIVRCRGRGHTEHEKKSPSIVSVKNDGEIQQVQLTIPDETLTNANERTKTYSLDHVFGPSIDQITFFQNSADKICDDFLKGFNCTIFAYGQTGAGKTYTMCGKIKNNSLTSESGIIPRCLFKLFDDESNKDLIFKCSFVEIYNEALKDLLSDGSNDNRLKIYEDKNVIKIKSLEEFYIKDFNEAMRMLKIGMDRKKMAATKMNEISSRSHSIFTIYLLKKMPNGSEYRFAKMNLVDLAGSENITRSGSTNQRAKEAGSINQSLLTLGRVINSLVDGSTFIPYRESKLTRLLQDSLGGKTKTVLVANIAPTLVDVQSTISTLEYASKAKNIKNTAQTGTLLPEDYLITELIESNRILKLDLMATRKRENCVVLDEDVYKELQSTNSSLKAEVEELRGLKISLLNQLDSQMKKIDLNKKEKFTLNENIQALEKKLVDFENKFKEQRKHEETLKSKFKKVCDKFNEDLTMMHESRTKIKMQLSNQILKSLVNIDSRISKINKSGSNTTSTVEQVHKELEGISSDLIKIIEEEDKLIPSLNKYNINIDKIAKDLDINKEALIKSINSLTGVTELNESSNTKFHLFLTKFMDEKDKNLMKCIQKRANEKVEEFKNKMSAEVEKLLNDNINQNYEKFLNHYRLTILDHENNWTSKNEELTKESKKQQTFVKESIIEHHKNVSNIVNDLSNDINLDKEQVQTIKRSLESLNKSIKYSTNETKVIHDKQTENNNLVSDNINRIKENIDNLNLIIKDIDDNEARILAKKEENERDDILRSHEPSRPISPLRSTLRSPTRSPIKLSSLNSKTNLSSSKIDRSPTRIPRSPTKSSETISPKKSPVKSNVGVKRELEVENLDNSKRKRI